VELAKGFLKGIHLQPDCAALRGSAVTATSITSLRAQPSRGSAHSVITPPRAMRRAATCAPCRLF
jgi:hypothetical protein